MKRKSDPPAAAKRATLTAVARAAGVSVGIMFDVALVEPSSTGLARG